MSLRTAAGLAGTAALAAAEGWQLSTYGPPILLDIVHGAMTWAVALTILNRRPRTGTTYRCPDCDFVVRLVRPAPGELDQWRAITSDHPHHAYQSLASR